MPRLRVIILEQEDDHTYRYALWADVPAARQSFYANPIATSVWKAATAADVTALQAGQVVERADKFNVPIGTPLAAVRALLQVQWQGFQDKIITDNPWVRYGTTWDGTTWIAGGVA